MKLATLNDGTRDGELIVVSRDLKRAVSAKPRVATLQRALETWTTSEALLRELADAIETGSCPEVFTVDTAKLAAPLPRAAQWLDGSAFHSHGDLMEKVFGLDPPADKHTIPLMYQGGSDDLLGANADVPVPSEALGIDFEAEVGVVVDDVPIGVPAARALDHVKLIVLINDVSLRTLAGREMKTGFGWIQAKPACSMAPFAVTPDALGDAWRDGRVCLDLMVEWNDEPFGRANGREMAYGFHELVAHAAATRDLVAGTVIGSGTIANANYAEVGSSCISERRAIEIIADGKPTTPFMRFGDGCRMQAQTADNGTPFGAIEQRVIQQPTGK